MKFDIDAALKEVQEKEEVDIEIETSYKWASRSCACYELYKETKLLKWLLMAESYAHESYEHASLACDSGKTLKIIEEEIDRYKNEVLNDKKESNYQLRQQKIAKLFND